MHFDEYVIGKIATNCDGNHQALPHEFSYQKKRFELLLPDVNVRHLLNDLKYVPNFRIDEFDDSLYLMLRIWRTAPVPAEQRHCRYVNSAQRIIYKFFKMPGANDPDLAAGHEDSSNETVLVYGESSVCALSDGDAAAAMDEGNEAVPHGANAGSQSEGENNGPEISIDELYVRLRDAHAQHDEFERAESVQHRSLLPTLTAYQRDAVQWMLHRETGADHFPSEYIEIHSRWPVDNAPRTTFYFHPRKIEITDEWIPFVDIPTGGILAEEMGLGKTVETLSLVLLNRRPAIQSAADAIESDEDPDYEPSIKKRKHTDAEFICVCTRSATKDETKLIACSQCRRTQHRRCVLKHVNSDDRTIEERYICPECWRTQPPVRSAATFIVSPASIKMQWHDEIERHIAGGDCKVLIYDGINRIGWISPVDLANYDVVITDYNVMASEIHFANQNKTDRQMRNAAVFMKMQSPLMMIDWWRVCLDEAQMVESSNNQAARMVKLLPAQHRWAVTGTPLEKSIHDLYGLLFFMNCEPYDDHRMWLRIAQQFIEGNADPITDVLRRIMWRTCKTPDILEQIKIPPQTEIVHYVTMSDLESFFYAQQHAECLEAFVKNARRVEEAENVAKINPRILKNIMEPLRKLRQDCTVPSIFERTDQATVKRSLNPNELYKHLFGNCEIECKTELRSIASSLNGLAALSVIRGDYATAAKQYRSVLRWAKDYTGNICVDSLLQVHALHNLHLMKSEMDISDELAADFATDLERLEWKYIKTNADIVKNIHAKQIEYAREIDDLESQFQAPKAEYIWWSDLLNEKDGQEDRQLDQLIRKIVLDIKDLYKIKDIEFTTSRGLTMIIVKWLDEVRAERQNVQKFFGKLDRFRENIKPLSKMNDSVRFEVERLINNAFQCHLSLENPASAQTPNKRKSNVECLLCKAKIVLETYECVIFDKKFVKTKDKEAVRGSWKSAYPEQILKILHAAAKSRHANKSILEDGKTHLKLLDALKNEFKEYSQLWVEINYTVSTFDEMNMCKSRLRVVDKEELERNKQKKTKMDVFTFEVDDTVADLNGQLKDAELKFIRKMGTLKYLRHLEQNKELQNCPICDQRPEHKYAVLECGHHVCMVCCLHMTKQHHQHSNIKCVICRHVQRVQNLYYVNLRKGANRTDSSSKVEQIVDTIVALYEQEAAVKIIIFSHWSNILKTIATALDQNQIAFRSQLNKFHITINEFKDPGLQVTCLLLPLRYGSKGLNLIEATHVFLVEPILNPSEELQAVGRVHRIGQTKATFVHRFIVKNTVEETIHKTIASDESGRWKSNQITVENLHDLFILNERASAE